ncbi:ATP-binding protein [Nocardia sp. NPDC059228]|uniref:ATP-binding protein n=1 Tax=Nocardia sp. NPDC059228 TaxID=3346777 RepID=UPI00368EB02C
MARLTVELANDHLSRYVGSPANGLAELIWNALDADADKVEVAVEIGHLGAPVAVTVTDDGHGMDGFDVHEGFGELGGSWKKATKLSRGQKRRLHGEQGKGRFAAFGLGERVDWLSVSESNGIRSELRVSGSLTSLRDIEISTPINTSSPTGTKVTVENLSEKAVNWLQRPGIQDTVTVQFAIYLESYPRAKILFNGAIISPSAMQEHRTEYVLDVEELRNRYSLTGDPKLIIIEWNRQVDRALYLCDAEGMTNTNLQAGIQAPGSYFTAYLKWEGFKGHDALLADLGAEPATSIVELARDRMREHFKNRAEERKRAIIKDWIDEGVYPYTPIPGGQTNIQTAERQLFDVVATAAAPAVNSGDKLAKRLSLRLLREAVETNPGELHKVLSSVLELPQERLSELSKLLDGTTLTSVINTSKQIADRLSFLAGLDAILFDQGPRKKLLERRQLHRILVNETWIFGEEYALTGDDIALTKVLRKHLEMLGEDVELADERPVLRIDGSNPIPDLVLARKSQIAQDRVEYLVIELKRPSVRLGSEELTQIEQYAIAIMRDERFNQPNVTWNFWVIGNSIDEYADTRRNQQGLPFGYIQRTNRFGVQVRTWAEVINDARHRLKFVEGSLNYQVTHDTGVEYLRETHAKYLPVELLDEQTTEDAESESEEASREAS